MPIALRPLCVALSLLTLSLNTFAIPVEQSTLSNPNTSVGNGAVRYIDSSPRATAVVNPSVNLNPSPVVTTTTTVSQTADLQQQISNLNQRIARQDGQIDSMQQELQSLKQKLATTTTTKKTASPTKQAEHAAAPATSKMTTTNKTAPTAATPKVSSPKTTTADNTPKDNLTDKAAYNKAYDAYQQGGAAKAIAPMQAFIKQYPDSPYVNYAHYWLGEFNLAITPAKYTTAKQNFQKVVQSYPKSSKAPAALYRLIEISQNVDQNTTKAKQYYQQLLKDYPKSKEAQNAKTNLHIDKDKTNK